MLPMVTVGTVDGRSIIDPIRDGYIFRDSNDYQCAYVTKIDTKNKELTCKSALEMKGDYDPTPYYNLKYDKLVIGVGMVTNTFNVPGVEEYAYFLKDVDHAHNIRRRFCVNLEKACQPNLSEAERRRLLQIVIVGGGPTGVETAGMIYDFMTKDLKKKYAGIEKYVKVNIYDAGKILANFDEKLQNTAQKILNERNNVNLFEETGVLGVSRDESGQKITLSDGNVLHCSIVIWTAGLKPNKLLRDMENDVNCEIAVNKRGFIEVDECLRTSVNDVYAIGDCSIVVDHPYQQAATVAEQQGEYLAKRLNEKNLNQPFKFSNPGMLANIGGHVGLTDIKKSRQSPVSAKFSGVYSWVVWRSAYLTKLGRWYNRFRVPLDYLRTAIWGRETSFFQKDARPKIEAPKRVA